MKFGHHLANLFIYSLKAALGEAILSGSHGSGMGNGGFEMGEGRVSGSGSGSFGMEARFDGGVHGMGGGYSNGVGGDGVHKMVGGHASGLSDGINGMGKNNGYRSGNEAQEIDERYGSGLEGGARGIRGGYSSRSGIEAQSKKCIQMYS